MMIEFIIGPAKSGKTSRCYQEIKKQLETKQYSNLIVLVPEQFNLQVQTELAHLFSPGLLRVEVMSFNNLARKVLGETGGHQEPIIDDLERVMILKKVIEEHKKELQYFSKSYHNEGFLDNINQLITVFEQNGIEEKFLETLSKEENAGSVFKYKISDFAKIYGWFNGYILNRFLTAEKTVERLAKSIQESSYLENAIVWIDGFYGFTTPQVAVITQMMKKVQHLVMTLPMDQPYEPKAFILPSNPFYDSIVNYQRFLGICEQEGLEKHIKFLAPKEEQVVDALHYLEQNYLKPYAKKYQEAQEQVELYSYANKEEEIEQTAKKIQQLVRENNYRYRDLAVLVGDLGSYRSSLMGTFKEYGIPVFIDDKKSIQTNGLVAVIQGVLDVILTGFSYKSVMSLLRMNMLGFEMEEIDLLENYLLENGIKGLKRWETQWERESKDVSIEWINELRVRLLDKILPLKVRIDQSKDSQGHLSIQEATTCIYHFLEDIQAYETIEARIAYYQHIKEATLERENTQIWAQVMEVFERLVDLLGEERISISAYRNLLKSSFGYVKMGVIPPTQDQVIVGTIDRTRIPQMRTVFVLGVNEGVIPKTDEGMPLFSDMDKATLNDICQAPANAQEIGKERLSHAIVNQPIYAGQFLVYSVLTRAREKLVMSTYVADDTGKTQRPSLVYHKLRKMFGQMTKEEDVLSEIQNPSATMGYVGTKLKQYLEYRVLKSEEDRDESLQIEADVSIDSQIPNGINSERKESHEDKEDKIEGMQDIWKDTLSWYMEQPVWNERIKGLVKEFGYQKQQHYLQPDNAKLLYPQGLETSISRLESYRSCPCCYFIKYGIKASERKLLEWNTADLGTLFHATLERYPKELEHIHKKWTEASEKEIEACVGRAVEYSVARSSYANKQEGKIQYTIKRVQQMSTRAIKALTYQLSQGKFEPEAYEVNFGSEGFPAIEIKLDDGTTVLLKGQIDRVDVYVKDAQTRYIKILDYKTGQKQFDLGEVYHSLQLQLLLYLDAYLRFNAHNKPAGMFYFHIDIKKIKYELGMKPDDAAAKQLQQFKLSGLALADSEIIENLEERIQGEIVPAKLKKDGTFSSASSVATEEQFDALRQYLLEAIKKLSTEILAGRISAKPCKLNQKDACAYCSYGSICQFEEGSIEDSYEKLEDLKPKEVWKRIESYKEGER